MPTTQPPKSLTTRPTFADVVAGRLRDLADWVEFDQVLPEGQRIPLARLNVAVSAFLGTYHRHARDQRAGLAKETVHADAR